MALQKTRGRPQGSENRDYDIVVVNESRCAKCGSTKRGQYTSKTEIECNGFSPDGTEYNRVVWRACECLDCGQWRRDKTYEK